MLCNNIFLLLLSTEVRSIHELHESTVSDYLADQVKIKQMQVKKFFKVDIKMLRQLNAAFTKRNIIRYINLLELINWNKFINNFFLLLKEKNTFYAVLQF